MKDLKPRVYENVKNKRHEYIGSNHVDVSAVSKLEQLI
jgi:hypothetical protein